MTASIPNITQPFFVDQQQPGVVRGGWFDELGGMLVGLHADWVCEVLNKEISGSRDKLIEGRDGKLGWR